MELAESIWSHHKDSEEGSREETAPTSSGLRRTDPNYIRGVFFNSLYFAVEKIASLVLLV